MSDPGLAGDTGTGAPRIVIAAGGVVLDGTGPATDVLVVHRPTYDDWSLPKGHVDPGEQYAGAALREVAEETGVIARITGEAGTTEHPVRLVDGAAIKRVHWFTMRPDGTDRIDPASRAPDGEVDRAAWWPVATALLDLTHAGERALLARVLDGR